MLREALQHIVSHPSGKGVVHPPSAIYDHCAAYPRANFRLSRAR